MKIYSNPNIQKVMKSYQTNNVKKTDKAGKTKMSPDKIEISSEARDIQVAMKALKETPEMRETKVQDLKEQIKNGTYKPTAEQIVDKLLNGLTK